MAEPTMNMIGNGLPPQEVAKAFAAAEEQVLLEARMAAFAAAERQKSLPIHALHGVHGALSKPTSVALTLSFFVAPLLSVVGRIPLAGKPFRWLAEKANLPDNLLFGRNENGEALLSVADASRIPSKAVETLGRGVDAVGHQAGRVWGAAGGRIQSAAGSISTAADTIAGKEKDLGAVLYAQAGSFFGRLANLFDGILKKPFSFLASRAGNSAAVKTEFANKAMLEKMEALAARMKDNPALQDVGAELNMAYLRHLAKLGAGKDVSVALRETTQTLAGVMEHVAEAATGENVSKELRKEAGSILREMSKNIVNPVQQAAAAGQTARNISAIPSKVRNLHTSIANMPTGEALQYGALATGTLIGLANTAKNATAQVKALQALHEELTGKKQSVLGIFKPSAPQIVKDHRLQLVKQFGPSVILEVVSAVIGVKFVGRGRGASWAVTGLSLLTGMGGSMLSSSGILTKHNILPEYVQMHKMLEHGLAPDPMLYAMMIEKLHPAAREQGGAENQKVMQVAAWCSEHKMPPATLVKIAQSNAIEPFAEAILQGKNPAQEVEGLAAMLTNNSKILGTHTATVLQEQSFLGRNGGKIAAGAVAVGGLALASQTVKGKEIIGAATGKILAARNAAGSYVQQAAAAMR